MKDNKTNGRNDLPSTSLISKSTSEKKKTKKNVRRKDNVGFFQKVSAVVTRLMFLLHTGLALWRVSLIYDMFYLYFLSIGVALLLLEMVFTLAVRQGKEYKWFCPSVFFYLLSVVPCLWFLELARLDEYQKLPKISGGCLQLPKIDGFNVTAEEDVVLQINKDQRRSIEYIDTNVGGNEEIMGINRNKRHANETNERPNIAQSTTTTMILTSNFTSANDSETQISISTVSINNNDSLGTQPDRYTEFASGEREITTTNKITVTETTASLKYQTNTTTQSHYTTRLPKINHVTTANPKLKSTTDAFDIPGDDVTTTESGTTNKVSENDATTHKTGIQNLGDSITHFGENTLMLIQNTTMTVNAFLNLLDPENWLLGLHQVLLFVLVIGRWLLPKGEISRDQLSQLLLVFIGVGADILEFVTETFDDEETSVKCNLFLHYVIYGVWSWSLIQFTLVLTAVKSRKERIGFTDRVQRVQNDGNCFARIFFKNADLWAILVTLLLQDVPFLVFRLYMMVVYNQMQQMMIFFTGKNILVVILQIYRIIVLQVEKKAERVDDIPDEELQPLRGTLTRLSAKARSFSQSNANADADIKDATFKSKTDGSVVVKIHLHKQKSKGR